MRPTVLLTCVFFASLCFGATNDVPQTPTQALKILEYPDLVISGGKIVVNNF